MVKGMEKVRPFAKCSDFRGATVLVNLLNDRIQCMVAAILMKTTGDRMTEIKVRITMIDYCDVVG